MAEIDTVLRKVADDAVVEVEVYRNLNGDVVLELGRDSWDTTRLAELKAKAAANRGEVDRADFVARERTRRQAEVDRLNTIQSVMDGPVSP